MEVEAILCGGCVCLELADWHCVYEQIHFTAVGYGRNPKFIQLGVLLFSGAMWRNHLLSRGAAPPYALGSIPVALANVFPATAVTIGGMMVALGIGRLGWELWQSD